MGWVWVDEDRDANTDSHAVAESRNPRIGDSYDVAKFGSSSNGVSTRRIVQTNCRTEEVEPGKFVRKCEKTEEVLRDCLGKPTEVVQSTKEYTEEDVTGKTQSFDFGGEMKSFDFGGEMKKEIFGIFDGISSFFDAAQEMRNEILGRFDDLPSFGSGLPSSSGRNRSIPIEEDQPAPQRNDPGSSSIDLSGLARDV